MREVGAGVTRTTMRVAFENARIEPTARQRPKPNKRALATRVRRFLERTNAGVIRHKKMAYVSRPN